MNGRTEPETSQFDVVVVGAGISGVNAGYRIQERLPHASYTILESRSELGGTWSFFKYPGIRSDSDLHTFGFPFNPWKAPNPIATGENIIKYIHETASRFGIEEHIQYKHKVVSADWSSESQCWRLEVNNDGNEKIMYAKFLIMATGYYDYDKPLEVEIPGLNNFKGKVVHPQFWPEDLDYKGKKMVIIGSGATAITITPAVVEGGVGNVTMLQRSPSYILSLPQKKPGQKSWYDYFPSWITSRLVRLQFYLVSWLLYIFCQKFPDRAARLIQKGARRQLPKDIPIDPHFKPSYNPWDQRLCLCPDGDFFKCFRSGRARIVTDTIKTVVEDGIVVNSGEKLDADIIVTATGLKLLMLGDVAISVDKVPVKISDQYLWRACMLSGVPNMGVLIGYVNASWTLGSDSSVRLLTRLINYMRSNNYTSTTPQISEEEAKDPQLAFGLNSTYIRRGAKVMPHAGKSAPWAPRGTYLQDDWNAKFASLRKGLQFSSVST
jgi:cation diffusion facilitator CzcD-associated flavoprotein CzcO